MLQELTLRGTALVFSLQNALLKSCLEKSGVTTPMCGMSFRAAFDTADLKSVDFMRLSETN